ncbi:MAG: hypothetical protein SFU85_10655 [Candidatus Methylacidiphilales bacterium]|nr:hypothetical protein [Candidatus Methylacidiphilales bacterium]
MSDSPNIRYSLRKKNETEVFGPMDFPDLKGLVDTAYVAPEDEISTDGQNWKLAHEWPDLEMIWKVVMADGQTYGPTSTGTIREFFSAGELTKEQKISHVTNGQTQTVAELLGEAFLAAHTAVDAADNPEADNPQLEETLEVARELRINQLEADLEKTKKDYDLLMHQYRRVSEELLQLKKKN